MELGAFSVSLSVRDLAASKAFYEALGFTEFGGDASQNWLIMKNGPHVIGLFQGMFDGNLLTFFIFYEALTLSTYPLVTHHGDAEAKRAGRVYLGVLVGPAIGGVIMLVIALALWSFNKRTAAV